MDQYGIHGNGNLIHGGQYPRVRCIIDSVSEEL